jgi:heat-inducible transcriptional repressor
LSDSSHPELSQRARRILYAAITEFVDTGEPVGSRTLAKRHGLDLSAASIRNVLADLEDSGYLVQPHTSAGRVPTDKAFRFFIDALLQVRPISEDDQRAIDERFAGSSPGGDMLRQAGKVLSELTGTAAMVVSPRPETRTLRQLRFIPTRAGELLAVLVMSDGSVGNCFISVQQDLSNDDVERVHEMLGDAIEGRTLGEVRELCARRLADDRVHYNELRRRAFDLGRRAVEGAAKSELVIEGQARLLDRPELNDIDRLKELMIALEDGEKLLELLDKTVTAERASVLVGHEVGTLGGGTLSVVSAPYLDHGRVAGAIGVLGVVRMDYSKVVPVVAATANAMTAAMDRARRDEG